VVKLLGIDGRKVLIEVGYQNDGIIEVRFLNGKPRKPVRMAAAQYVWEWFDLETDLTPFYQAAEGDPLLKKLVHEYFGLRIG
jgi:DNA-3-methyladenine glycosylase II